MMVQKNCYSESGGGAVHVHPLAPACGCPCWTLPAAAETYFLNSDEHLQYSDSGAEHNLYSDLLSC